MFILSFFFYDFNTNVCRTQKFLSNATIAPLIHKNNHLPTERYGKITVEDNFTF